MIALGYPTWRVWEVLWIITLIENTTPGTRVRVHENEAEKEEEPRWACFTKVAVTKCYRLLDQQYSLPEKLTCVSELSPRRHKGGESSMACILPWPEIIFSAVMSSPNDHCRCPCMGAMAVSRRPRDGRGEVGAEFLSSLSIWSWPDLGYEWSKTGEAKGTWEDAKLVSSSLLFSPFYR